MTIEEIRDRVIALEKQAERENERHRFLEDRLIILEKTQAGVQDIRLMIERLTMGSDNTKQSFSDLNARLDRMAKRIEEIDNKLECHVTQQDKAPGEKWEKAKWVVVAGVISGVLGYLLKSILP
jgi:septation ring formation regulator EzrA